MTGQHRQPAGTPTGGQFAATGRAEALVELDAPGTPAQRDAVDGVAGALASTFGVDPADLDVTMEAEPGCGRPAGSADCGVGVDVPGEHEQTVSMHLTVTPDGHVGDLRCVASYRTQLPGAPWERDTVASNADPAEPVTGETVRRLLDDTMDQARMQRAADTLLNARVHATAEKYGARSNWHERTQVIVTRGGTHPLIAIERNGKTSQRVTLEVDRATGQVTGARLHTEFGPLHLSEDAHLETTTTGALRELCFAIGDYDGARTASRTTLERVLRSITTGEQP